jgi:hypothetical protein
MAAVGVVVYVQKDVEEWVVRAITAGLIEAKMDQQQVSQPVSQPAT